MRLFKKKKKNPLTPEQLKILDKSVYYWDYEKLKENKEKFKKEFEYLRDHFFNWPFRKEWYSGQKEVKENGDIQ